MRRICVLSFLVFLGLAANPARPAFAQAHFQQCVSGTGNNASLVVPSNIPLSIDGAAFASGDEIAVFTPDGACAGAAVWNGSSLSITIWGDDQITSAKESFAAGEVLHYRVWDASAETEYGSDIGSVAVSYSSSQSFYRTDGLYGENAIYVLASLTVTLAPPMPTLVSPADGASGLGTSVSLSWSSVSGADSYEVQVAGTADFSSPVAQQTGLTATSYSVTGLDHAATYYWRVRAVNAAGAGVYSAARSFSTLALQQIQLEQGWNLISSYIAPTDSSMEAVFAGVQDHIVLVKDAAGETFSPEFGINTIGNWRSGEGYFVYADAQATLSLSGRPIVPEATSIGLMAGWNIIPYWLQAGMAVSQALSSIQSALVLVKDASGNVYMPAFSIDEIGSLQPGLGYQAYVQAAATLLYPAP